MRTDFNVCQFLCINTFNIDPKLPLQNYMQLISVNKNYINNKNKITKIKENKRYSNLYPEITTHMGSVEHLVKLVNACSLIDVWFDSLIVQCQHFLAHCLHFFACKSTGYPHKLCGVTITG